MEDINLSYETLYGYLRREKENDELQQLPSSFYNDTVEYIITKKSAVKDLFSREGKQLVNIKKIISEIYERREKKICMLALLIAKVGPEMVDSTNMLPEEKSLLTVLTDDLKLFRSEILAPTLKGEKPVVSKAYTSEPKSDKMFIRFLHSVPRFVGEELEVYGPFEKEDVANIPSSLAKVLIEKERAEEMKLS
jgi:DNA replication initiation complex subunit (GINS family)